MKFLVPPPPQGWCPLKPTWEHLGLVGHNQVTRVTADQQGPGFVELGFGLCSDVGMDLGVCTPYSLGALRE